LVVDEGAPSTPIAKNLSNLLPHLGIVISSFPAAVFAKGYTLGATLAK
jgi:hypothetical protein